MATHRGRGDATKLDSFVEDRLLGAFSRLVRRTAQVATPDFKDILARHGLPMPGREATTTLQVNVGSRCNQACHHCHVDASPTRAEMMTRETAERVLALLKASPGVRVLDITGGAPELNHQFRHLVVGARTLGRGVIDRCNLTVLFEPGQEDTPEFLASHRVRVVASLPCYTKENVEKQRGSNVFEKSIRALRWLNRLGYGDGNPGLVLDLVYNPLGAFLPPPQESLEARYREELGNQFGIRFNNLLTITNMPIKRFARDLARQNKREEYVSLLVNHLNPETVQGLMCRTLVSVGYDGQLYDCDFNQMLGMPLGGQRRTVWDINELATLTGDHIATASHCLACTAGGGSSCGGALT